MLPLKSLDDGLFADIIAKARAGVNKYYPDWTDYNPHDPGITFIELFAWLKEMQEYHLDQIGAASRKKFLKLLGITPKAKNPATAFVNVCGLENDLTLPAGTCLKAGDVFFETSRREYLTRARLTGGAFLGADGKKVTFDRQLTEGGKMHFHLFGPRPGAGDALYLNLDTALPPGEIHHLYLDIFTDYAVKRNKPDENFAPLARIEWEYFAATAWRRLTVIEDATLQFIQSGRIAFTLDGVMAPSPAPEEGFQLRAVLQAGDYEVAPVLAGAFLTMVPVIQKNTLSGYRDFQWSEGVPDGRGARTFTWDTALALGGRSEVYIGKQQESGLIFWDKIDNYRKEIDSLEVRFYLPELTVTAAEGEPREGEDYGQVGPPVRLVCYDEAFSLRRLVGEGDGFPYQSFEVQVDDLLAADFELMVQEERGFVHWEKAEDFDRSGPESRCYILDESTSTLIFGDCEQGLAPEGEILIIACADCYGQGGNVKEERINSFHRRIPAAVSNPAVAAGGMDAETVDEAFLRLRKELRKVERAVAYEDYEALARVTPGLMIQNCKTIPVTKIPRRDGSMDENAVSIVVQPFAIGERRKLTPAYIENIHRQLEHRRLIGAKVNILSPEYVGIRVFAEILVKPYYQDAPERIEKAVAGFFGDAAWEFGQTVQHSAIYGTIDTLDCVVGIQSLTIDAHGKGIKRSVNGDVNLPQNGLAYLEAADYMITAGE